MKPNNLVALLIVAILLAIGVALAVINQRSESEGKADATRSAHAVALGQFQQLS